MNIIQTENLTKKFGDTTAVDKISLNVRKGEIYGFLGLNGAGKTTAIRLLLGMIKPDSGHIALFGKTVEQASKIWNRVGYMVETPYSYPDLTVKENLEVYYKLRGLTDPKAIDKALVVLQLDRYKDKPSKHLSMGNKQRLGLAKALLHGPELLILDEPINGLDPSGIAEIRAFLRELVSLHDTTIFLSSHILSEISKLATRIGIVHEGKLIKEIDATQLEDQTLKKLLVKTIDNHRAIELLSDNGIKGIVNEADILEITSVNAINQPETIASLLVNSGLPPKMLMVTEEDLETYFLRIISGQKN